MFLTENAFSPFKKYSESKIHLPDKYDLLSQSFDEALLRRIKALNPPSLSLSFLAQAVDLLGFAHAQLISSLKVSPIDESLSCYLDSSVKVLDVCNSALAQIERLKQRRLHFNFLVQLLASDPVKARDFVSKSEIYSSSSIQIQKRGFEISVEDLVRDIARVLDNPQREKKTSGFGRLVRRMIHAVGLLTVSVADVSISMLYGFPGSLVEIRAIPHEFAWADSFNSLASTVSTQLKQRLSGDKSKAHFQEIHAVESRIELVLDVIDSDDRVKFDGAVKELEKAAASFSVALDQLSDGMNGMFNRVLSSRNGILDGIRSGQQKQKNQKKL